MQLTRRGRRARFGRTSLVLGAAVAACWGGPAAAHAASGTWISLVNGNWNLTEPANWAGGIVADGADATADFSTVDITADRTVSLTEARTIGNLIFADATTPSNNWILSSSVPANALTLAVTAGSPTITVNNVGANRAVTINSNLLGVNGLTKAGTGQLTLTGTNTYTGGTTVSGGILLATRTAALPGYNSLGQVIVNAGTLAVTGGGTGFTAADIDAVRASALFAGGTTLGLDGTFSYASNIGGTHGLTKIGSGTVTLTGTNSYSGGTTVSGGILLATRTAALSGYNSPGQVVVNAGTLGLTAGGLGFTSGDIDTVLANGTFNTGSAVGLQVDSTFAYNANIATALPGLSKLGTGTLTLTGSVASPLTIAAGAVSLDSGSLNLASMSTTSAVAGARLAISGGTFTSTGTATFNANGATGGLVMSGGTANFGTLATSSGADGSLLLITGGTVNATLLNIQRSFNTGNADTAPTAGQTTSGLYINGAGANVTFGDMRVSTSNAGATARIDAGTLNVTNGVILGGQNNSGAVRWSILDVNGGTVTVNGAAGITLGADSADHAERSILLVRNGTTTTEKIAFGDVNTLTTGRSVLTVSGGTLYVGSGGIVKNAAASYATFTNLTAGTLGAKGDWSSDQPVALNGATFTVKAADAADVAHDITFAGAVSGAGALTKTGGGTLHLTATNTYTSNITVAAGGLTGTSDSLRNTIDNAGLVTFNQSTNGTFGGAVIGAGAVRKTGAGTLTLGAQSYTGATTVGGGKLQLSGTYASSGVTVENGAALGLGSGGATINALTLGAAGGDAMTLAVNSGAGLQTLNVTNSGGLIANGATTIDIGIAGITVGTHTLVDYAGAIGGSGFAGFTLGTLPSRVSANLVNNPAGSIDLNVTLVDFPRWEGTVSDDWDINTSQNWKEATSGNATTYLQNAVPGDQVLFTDAATGTTAVDITTTVQPTFITVSNFDDNYSFNSGTGGKISGPGGLTKQGTGSLTINNTGNDYSGATTISGGSVILGTSNVLSDASAINVNGGTLDLGGNSDQTGAVTLTSGTIAATGGQLTAPSYDLRSGTVNAALLGAGGLNKTTAGTVALNAAATYTGTTRIEQGTLQLGVGNTLPIASGVVLGSGGNSGTLDLNGNFQIVESLATSGTGTANRVVNAVGGAPALLLVAGTTSTTYAGAIDGNIALYLSSPSPTALTLSGTSTYTGGTIIDFGGTLAITSDAALGAVPASPAVNVAFVSTSGGILRAVNSLTLDANRLIDTGGTTFTFDAGTGANVFTINGNVQGGGFLNKVGNGTVILNGTGAFSSTTITAGGLRAGNANAVGTGDVTIAAGAGNGMLQLANGVTLTNNLITNSTSANNMVDAPEAGATATFAGNVTPGVAGAQYRPGATGDGATLVLTGNATITNTLVVAQGNVVLANNGVIAAGQGLFGRASTPSMSFTAKDNAVVTLNTNVNLGNDNNVPSLAFTVQDNAAASVGTTFDLIQVNATPVAAHSDVNLNGGTLTVGSFLKSSTGGTRTAAINFNGGVLRPVASNAAFLPALAGAVGNVKNGGAIIDTNGFDITVAMPLRADGTGGLTKNGAGVLTMGGVHTWNGATTLNAGGLKLAPGATSMIKGGAVSIANGLKIDLTDNKLITTSPAGTFAAGAYTGVAGLVDSARGNAGNALWDGPTGITTTDARAINNGDLLSIGVATVAEARNLDNTATTTFMGQTVLGSDTIAMATWGGDATLDGKINIDDYGQIDSNVSKSGTVFGWNKGDFNYDGKINIDDYGIIDGNIGRQTGTIPTAGGIGEPAGGSALDGVAAVPEPASLSLVALGAMGLMRRRRRVR